MVVQKKSPGFHDVLLQNCYNILLEFELCHHSEQLCSHCRVAQEYFMTVYCACLPFSPAIASSGGDGGDDATKLWQHGVATVYSAIYRV